MVIGSKWCTHRLVPITKTIHSVWRFKSNELALYVVGCGRIVLHYAPYFTHFSMNAILFFVNPFRQKLCSGLCSCSCHCVFVFKQRVAIVIWENNGLIFCSGTIIVIIYVFIWCFISKFFILFSWRQFLGEFYFYSLLILKMESRKKRNKLSFCD